MISKWNKNISLTRQCELAGINKSSLYYHKRAEPESNLLLMKDIDLIHTKHPYFGARRIQKTIERKGEKINIKRIRRLMCKMSILTHYPKRNYK